MQTFLAKLNLAIGKSGDAKPPSPVLCHNFSTTPSEIQKAEAEKSSELIILDESEHNVLTSNSAFVLIRKIIL